MSFPSLVLRITTRRSLLWLVVLAIAVVAAFLPRTTASMLARAEKSAPSAVAVRQVTLATKDLVYDPVTQRIYASVPGSGGGIANSITQIDPVAGNVGASVSIGSEPGKLAISGNSQYLYVSLDGAAAVRRFDLTTQTAGLQFPLGSDSGGAFYAEDIAVLPGQPDSVAISRKYQGGSPRHTGVGVFDNGVLRPTTTPTHTGSNVIEFSPTAATLYGLNNETSEFGFRKMAVNASGVSVVSTTANVIGGFGVDIDYDNGLMYSTNGQVIDPETRAQVGRFSGIAGTALVLADSAANRVYFLRGSGVTTTLLAYDQTTFLQTGTLPLPSISGTPSSLIKWGADGLAFRTNGNQVVLLSTSEIVPVIPTPIPSPTQVANGIVSLPLVTSDLVYDSNTAKIYASLPSSAGSFGNSIAPINPATGIMDVPVLVGSEPGKLAISGNLQFIYAGIDGAGAVRRFDLATQSASLQFSLGIDQFNGPYYVEDMAVLPGNANAVAISRRNLGFSPRHQGVGIYDNGVVRATVTPGHIGSNAIEFSSSAATLYGYDSESSDAGFRKMTVNAGGVSTPSTTTNLIGFATDIRYANGRVYASTGRVINPEAATIVGNFPGANSPAFLPDSASNRAFFVTDNGAGSATLQAFDLNTLLPVGSLNIPGVSGAPGNLIRWGQNGLAFRTSGNQLFLVQTSLVQTLVNDEGDAADLSVGDGSCDTSLTPGEQCTLRAAIEETNAQPADDGISFSPSLNGKTITLTTALPDITGNLNISGPGASLLSVRRSSAGGTPNFRIFTINLGKTVTISGLTIANGSASGTAPANFGGGVLNDGTLTVTGCVITGNAATSGGGLANHTGTMTIANSTIDHNTAATSGGGISNGGESQSPILTVSNSTISNNTAQSFGGGGVFNIANASFVNSTISTNSSVNGGGIHNVNPMALINVTVAGNSASSAGGGIYNPGIGSITFGNSLIAGNTSPSGPDCNGFNLSSQDYNLIGNTSGGNFTGTTTHNLTNVNALLGPLAANGGSTLTHALLVGSPAIDAGNSAQAADQRGQPRPVDDQTATNAAGGNASDIGAYEAHNFEVNTTSEGDDGVCRALSVGNGCTLREAVNAANAEPGADLILFAPALTASGPNSIHLATALPDLSSDMTIRGPGNNLMTVERLNSGGVPEFRIFNILSGRTVELTGFVIFGGRLTGVSGAGILNSGTLTINNCAIADNRTNLVGGGILNTGTLTVNNTGITFNVGGGIANDSSGGNPTATINNSDISSNTGKGGIYNNALNSVATLAINNSTITGNSSTNSGGGVYNFSGSFTSRANATINSSLISGNSSSSGGGGIGNGAFFGNAATTMTITNSTISGNSDTSSFGGGGIYHVTNGAGSAATLTLTNTTITANNAGSSGAGGGILITDPAGTTNTLRLRNNIVAGNFRNSGSISSDISGTVDSSGSFNLIGDNSGLIGLTNGTNGNQIGTSLAPINPQLGPLANNGGPTKTQALLPGSPATDAGDNCVLDNSCSPALAAALTTDQRGAGFNRAVDANGDGIATVDIGAYEVESILVTNTNDSGVGSLRKAITDANASVVSEAILFQPGLTGTITLLSALPDITGSVMIAGPGANLLTVERSTAGGTPDFRIFTVTAGTTVTISGLKITNGRLASGNSAQDFGGGLANSGTLTISECEVSNNVSDSGGGIYSDSSLTVINSSIINNVSIGSVAGILSTGSLNITSSTVANNVHGTGVFFGGGTLATINNSTISNNTAPGSGAGLQCSGGPTTVVNITNTTITGNRADTANNGGIGGGLLRLNGVVTLRNTIVAGNFRTSGPIGSDISGTVASASSFNLIGDDSGLIGLTNGTNGNQIGTSLAPINPQLGPLANNGGPTKTQALLPGSPASDAGDNCVLDNSCSPALAAALTTDQRGAGFNRAVDANGDGTTTVDIGAYEGQSILVTNTNDSGAGSLRQAITEANASPGSDAINFQAGLTGTISLLSALPDLNTSIAINGPGSSQLTIQRSSTLGTPEFRIFTITSGGSVTISGATIANGLTSVGGGVRVNSGAALNLQGVKITGNTANSSAGGIFNNGGAVTMTSSTVSGNHAETMNGGIFNSGTLTITNSTVSSNTTGIGNAGGISNGGTLTLTNSTVTGNSTGSGSGGGIFNSVGTMTLTNSTITENSCTVAGCGISNGNNSANLSNTIVAGNFSSTAGSPANDIDGTVNSSSSFNLIGAGGSGGLTNGVNNNQVGVADPRLGSLVDNGGPTQTHALLGGSPALDAGNNVVVTNPPFSAPPFTDQRGSGFARIVDGPDADTTDTVDIGAFEAQVSLPDLADQSMNEDAALPLLFNLGGAASITSVTAISSNPTLVPNNPANLSISGSGSTRTLQINPVANTSGTSTITVTVNGSNSQTMTDTFVLTVNAVNDAPSFTKGPDQTVNENDDAQTVNNWATNMSAGPADESGQALTFIFTNNSNPALFAVAPAVSSAGTLTYTPAASASGTASLKIALQDNGGTANGGINTSATQTFNITVQDGGELQFNSPTFAIAEDGGNAVITVTRTGGSAGEARVNYATTNGTATAGQDYTSASGTLTFPNGVTTQSFNVAITNDAVDEPDEAINLTLTNAAGTGSVGTPATAVLTIIDNDPPALSIDNTAVNEGDSGTANATFTVTLSSPSSQTVTVNYATANGTATAGSDYQAASGMLTFSPLETTKSINVVVNGDVNFEPNEAFVVNLSNPVNATIAEAQGGAQITNDDAQGGFIAFSQPIYTVGEGGGFTTVTVSRTNDLSGAATVEYFTRDYSDAVTEGPCSVVSNIASSRCDYTSASGTLRFEPGETSKTFVVLISQDNYLEGPEQLSLTLTNPTGGALLGNPPTAGVMITDDVTEPPTNPIDSADAFVRQHYHDFLNREPDAAGLAFWTNQITECQQPGAICNAEVRRINVSGAFFLSIEFQETGYLVYRVYKSAYGNLTGAPVPLRLSEFLPDTQQIGKGVVIGEPGADQRLENNKVAFALDFVSRPRFTTAYPTTLSPAEFVDALFANAVVTPATSDRDAAINEFGGTANTADTAARARALRLVAENSLLKQQETNRAFVLMQYFGYLRRNPYDPPETGRDFAGYNFWLGKLNEFNSNFVNAEMVKSFLVSGEYRGRFGP